MEKLEKLYEGKAKKLYATDDPDVLWVEYMNQATAGNGEKKAQIEGKGSLNNRITSVIFDLLKARGVDSHFVRRISETEQLVKKMDMYPLEIIMRNTAAGSFAKRYGVEEGIVFAEPTLEFSYKNDDLGDPLLNTSHALALGLATKEEIARIQELALKVNELLKARFARVNITLVDFKLEFGRLPDGSLVLADEISPDTCRFWDSTTHEKLDKDRFRRDLGGVEDAYNEVMRRVLAD